MDRLNPCVTGDTKVLTVKGLKTFKELADAGDDVDVYAIDENGGIWISTMVHPRVTGYNVEIVKITLADGTVLKASHNHEFLTENGYVPAEDIMEGDRFPSIIEIGQGGSDKSDYEGYTGTKKGTVIKKCEVTGEEFETTWEEREVCAKPGNEAMLCDKVEKLKSDIRDNFIKHNFENSHFIPVKSVEFLDERENVYNGTVALYHNYFTSNGDIIVNQMNCGE